MRGKLLICGASAVVATLSIVACAASEDKIEIVPLPDSGGNEVAIQDGGEPDAAVDAKGIDDPKCSEAGWCRTALPDEDLLMKDIWPVGAHAFAIADSPTLGIKVLEWSDAAGAWHYIDDGTQNTPGLGNYAGKIWAPNDSAVYVGVGPGYIFHGKRPVPPATAWEWTKRKLTDNSRAGVVDPLSGYPQYSKLGDTYPALGVWGTSADDVYAWFTNTIYHWTSVDGGAPEWVPEYVADDAASSERLLFLAAAGASPDSMWFSGARSRGSAGCAVLVRKIAGVYRRIADGTLTTNRAPCTARAESLLIGGAEGWLTDLQATAQDQVIGLKGARTAVRISGDGDGYAVAVAPTAAQVTSRALNSLWVAPENLWLSAQGLVVRTTGDVWDGGAYRVSPITLRNAPVNGSIYQVRGTSNTNLWAIGVHHALHKTTP